MKPNLFDYATSELSQDAFLCWLLAWAHPDNQSVNNLLHRTGTAFLKALYLKAERQAPEVIKSIEITKQDGSIDVLCIVNAETAIIIEDKTGTSQHTGQLERYKNHILSKGYSADKIIPIYMKTGDQSDFSEVIKSGYFIFKRNDLLQVLEPVLAEPNNNAGDIFADYTAYLRRIEDAVQSYATTKPADWTWYAWQGFFNKTQEHLNDGNWDYVPNLSGGFLGYWWCFLGDSNCEQYLQLEQEELCFKIFVSDQTRRTELRDFWHNKIMQRATGSSLSLKRPNRLGLGAYMTVAVLDNDCRITDDQGLLDFPKTISVIRSAEAVLRKCVGQN
jgi:hypothetical protein